MHYVYLTLSVAFLIVSVTWMYNCYNNYSAYRAAGLRRIKSGIIYLGMFVLMASSAIVLTFVLVLKEPK